MERGKIYGGRLYLRFFEKTWRKGIFFGMKKKLKEKNQKIYCTIWIFFPVSFMMSVTTFMPIQILIQIQNCHIQF